MIRYERLDLGELAFKSRHSVFSLLSLQPLDVLAGTVDLSLIAVNLLLLLVIGDFVTLQLIADQCSRAETETASDSRSSSRITDGGADTATRRRATEGAYAGAFLACGQRSTGATR